MEKRENNYAFLDGQNINSSVNSLGWHLDFKRFKVYLEEKYSVEIAYLFIGYIEANTDLYKALQEAGFIYVFKPIVIYKDGKIKGNCDAEFVLQTMIEFTNYDNAVIVTGDGDFYCLVKYLISKDKLKVLIIPNQFKFSTLLKLKEFRPYLHYMNGLKSKLEYKKKSPRKDETLKG